MCAGGHGTLHASASLGRMSKAKVSAGQGSPEALYTVEANMGAGPGSLRGTYIQDMLAGQLKWM